MTKQKRNHLPQQSIPAPLSPEAYLVLCMVVLGMSLWMGQHVVDTTMPDMTQFNRWDIDQMLGRLQFSYRRSDNLEKFLYQLMQMFAFALLVLPRVRWMPLVRGGVCLALMVPTYITCLSLGRDDFAVMMVVFMAFIFLFGEAWVTVREWFGRGAGVLFTIAWSLLVFWLSRLAFAGGEAFYLLVGFFEGSLVGWILRWVILWSLHLYRVVMLRAEKGKTHAAITTSEALEAEPLWDSLHVGDDGELLPRRSAAE
ncbi:MAG: hypothetical protein SF029_08855 [bacterium]|nr:hypothetical protein [bacterium]